MTTTLELFSGLPISSFTAAIGCDILIILRSDPWSMTLMDKIEDLDFPMEVIDQLRKDNELRDEVIAVLEQKFGRYMNDESEEDYPSSEDDIDTETFNAEMYGWGEVVPPEFFDQHPGYV